MSLFDRNAVIGACVHGNNLVTCVQCNRERRFPLNHPISCTCKLCLGDIPVSGSMVTYNHIIEATPYEDINNFLEECLETMRVKGHDYREGNDADLLHNFRTVGEDAELPMEKVWYIYASKHWKAIKTYIKSGGQSESEPIDGRIKDMIVYLLLFYRMTHKGEGTLKKKETVVFYGEKLPLMAEPLEELGKTFEANTAGSLGVPITIKEPGKEIFNIDPQKMYKLIGEPGKFVPPEITQHAKEIINQLQEQEKSSLPPTVPGYFPEDYGKNPVLDVESKPLTQQQLEDINDVIKKAQEEREKWANDPTKHFKDFNKGEWPHP